jgi:Ca2+-binding RTX toxin-like protein
MPGNGTVLGRDGNDRLFGGNNTDRLSGNLGADFFSGGLAPTRTRTSHPAQGDSSDGT